MFHLVGAFDRHNYGDMLFPLVHAHIIRGLGVPDNQINFYSITAGNTLPYGGVHPRAVCELYGRKLSKADRIVIVGGDVLAADWIGMLANGRSRLFAYVAHGSKRVLGSRRSNNLYRNLFANDCGNFPYILDQNRLAAKVHYCSVGGTSLRRLPADVQLDIYQNLQSAESLSVRDKLTQAILNDANVPCALVPDVAAMIPEVFDRIDLEKRVQGGIFATNESNKSCAGVVCFQVGINYSRGQCVDLANQLVEINKMTGHKIRLVPIGLSPGHEDMVPLRMIYDLLSARETPVELLVSAHVKDIMASLALSDLYVGSSLHGAITANAYGVPVCAIYGARVGKLTEYIKTWMTDGAAKTCVDGGFQEPAIAYLQNPRKIGVELDVAVRHRNLLTLKKYLANSVYG
jgi:Polysaccharide pyruvyl transferase